MSNLEVTATQLWNDTELAASVNAYLAMLVQQIEGKLVSKAAIVQELQQGDLRRRSASSISRRMSNISSVLYDLKMHQVQGYAPLPNVGSAVKARIIELLIQGGIDRIAPYAATNDQVELADRGDGPEKDRGEFHPHGSKGAWADHGNECDLCARPSSESLGARNCRRPLRGLHAAGAISWRGWAAVSRSASRDAAFQPRFRPYHERRSLVSKLSWPLPSVAGP